MPKEDIAFSQMSSELHFGLFNLFNSRHLHNEWLTPGNSFSILRLLARHNRWSVSELAYLCGADPIMQQVSLMHFFAAKHSKRLYDLMQSDLMSEVQVNYHSYLAQDETRSVDISIIDFVKKSDLEMIYRE